jgi:hypothetical protein
VSRDQAGIIEVQVVGIVRSADGAPASVSEPLDVVTLPVAPIQIVWADAVSLAILASPGENQAPIPRIATVGGRVVDLRPPGAAGDPPVAIAAGSTHYDIFVATESRYLYVRSGQRWTRLMGSVRLPVTPS